MIWTTRLGGVTGLFEYYIRFIQLVNKRKLIVGVGVREGLHSCKIATDSRVVPIFLNKNS